MLPRKLILAPAALFCLSCSEPKQETVDSAAILKQAEANMKKANAEFEKRKAEGERMAKEAAAKSAAIAKAAQEEAAKERARYEKEKLEFAEQRKKEDEARRKAYEAKVRANATPKAGTIQPLKLTGKASGKCNDHQKMLKVLEAGYIPKGF